MRSFPGEFSSEHLGALAIGTALWGVQVCAWLGVWRNWAGSIHGPVIAVLPGLGTMALAYGIGPAFPFSIAGPLLLLSLLVGLAGFVLMQWDPPWFGPAWYREFKRTGDRSTTSAGMVTALFARPTPGQHSENTARHARRPRTPLIRRHASLLDPELTRPTGLHTAGLASGHLLYYDDELVFAADAADDAARPGPTIRTIPADTITAVHIRPTPRTKTIQIRFPSLHITTTTGTDWHFECTRARRAADDIRRLYTGTRR